MSETIILAIISGLFTLAGTIITVLSSAAKTRREHNNRLTVIERKVDDHIAENRQDIAVQTRQRILRYANDVRRGVEFSRECWESILVDITSYKSYVADHPKFKNEICVHAVDFLLNNYDILLEQNGFAPD